MAKKQAIQRRKVKWTIRVAMAKAGIRSVSALRKMLAEYGLEISTPQLGRVVDGEVQNVNMNIINALMNVLDCPLEELMHSEIG
jgi:DNA-binding Xre family transcriptional regulator